ncbi:MAG TPA: ABC transporter ATP-binding protein [Candidatus Limnocylindrales bacterium]|nr:ABC transporter ATP-binding protein [Candidatus Limnocylindrales bacterium]
MTGPADPRAMAPAHASGTPAGRLRLAGLTKLFGDVRAVDDVSLDIPPGEFVTFLGPSGSGKTTTLRMIAGFLEPDSGSVELDGRSLGGVPPYRRDIGMVFQNYALFPHMTAEQNLAFPLEMRGVARDEIKRRVAEALALVRLEPLGRRYPRQLSGGQQQRIALARAIVFRPRLLLMDEPLGALDRKLREALQLEIIRVRHELGVTVVYVTHDQEEALALSDRIAIFNAGRIEQLGTGEELYERPATLFVADFMGESNIFRGRLAAGADGAWLSGAGGRYRLDGAASGGLAAGSAAALVVRPEKLWLGAAAEGDRGAGPGLAGSLAARVEEVIYLGSTRKYVLRLPDGGQVIARRSAGEPAPDVVAGTEVAIGWRPADAVLLPDDSAAPG